MDRATSCIAEYVGKLGIKISSISRGTGVPDGILRRSLSAKERDLRADEFLAICNFLGKSPFDFYQHPSSGRAEEAS